MQCCSSRSSKEGGSASESVIGRFSSHVKHHDYLSERHAASSKGSEHDVFNLQSRSQIMFLDEN